MTPSQPRGSRGRFAGRCPGEELRVRVERTIDDVHVVEFIVSAADQGQIMGGPIMKYFDAIAEPRTVGIQEQEIGGHVGIGPHRDWNLHIQFRIQH